MNATSLKIQFIAASNLCGPSTLFLTNTALLNLCAPKRYGKPFSELCFPLQHKRMQTVLLAREIGRLMTWDGDSKRAVNEHFQKLGITRKAFSDMGALTIDDVFRSVILATLKSSDNCALRAATTRSSTTWTTTRT